MDRQVALERGSVRFDGYERQEQPHEIEQATEQVVDLVLAIDRHLANLAMADRELIAGASHLERIGLKDGT